MFNAIPPSSSIRFVYLILYSGVLPSWMWTLYREIKYECLHSSTCRHQVIPAPFVEDAHLFPFYDFVFCIKNQECVGVWIYFWVFILIPLINMSLLIPIPCSFYYYCSVVQLESKDYCASRCSFIVQESFSYPVAFYFFRWNEYWSFKVCKGLYWSLMGIAQISIDFFW